jgi:hypothetical protein
VFFSTFEVKMLKKITKIKLFNGSSLQNTSILSHKVFFNIEFDYNITILTIWGYSVKKPKEKSGKTLKKRIFV